MPDNATIYRRAWTGPVVDPQRWPSHATITPHLHGRVVEVGPGLFPRSCHPDTVYVEPVPAVVVRLRAAGLQARVASIEDLPFADRSVDTLVAFDVLEHCPDDEAALAEVVRVLRPGGALIAAVPMNPRYFSPLDRMVGHARRYSPDALLSRLATAGLQIEAGRWIEPVHPVVKHITDRLQWAVLSVVGLDVGLKAKAWATRLVPKGLPAAPLGPLGQPPPQVSRAVFVARVSTGRAAATSGRARSGDAPPDCPPSSPDDPAA